MRTGCKWYQAYIRAKSSLDPPSCANPAHPENETQKGLGTKLSLEHNDYSIQLDLSPKKNISIDIGEFSSLF